MFNIPDSAWKFGCGRYIQKSGALLELGNELRKFATKGFFISGTKSWNSVEETILTGLKGFPFRQVVHSLPCCEESARCYAKQAESEECDVIVGIGGGTVIDIAKLTAEFSNLPVVTIPTISATCAAFTPLSVVYTPEGQTRGSWFSEKEISCCICDTDVLNKQPLRYIASGIMDTLAKIIEIRHNLQFENGTPDLFFASEVANYVFTRLRTLSQCLADSTSIENYQDVIEEIIYLIIPATGIVSGSARGRMQSALGHCFYESVRTIFTNEAAKALHGEIVGVGLRIQMLYDFNDSEPIDSIMKIISAPMSISSLGITFSKENVEQLINTIRKSNYVEGRTYDYKKLQKDIISIW